MCKKRLFIHFNLLFLCMWLQVINKVKTIQDQSQGHTSRSRSNQGIPVDLMYGWQNIWIEHVIDRSNITRLIRFHNHGITSHCLDRRHY